MRLGKKQQSRSERTEGYDGPGIRLDDDELDIERTDPLDEYDEFADSDEARDDRRRDPLRH
jgi:hypothetical protein